MADAIITPEAIISYPNLYEPKTARGAAKAKYSCALIFTKDANLKEMKLAIIATAKEKYGEKAVDMIRDGSLWTPFRKDVESKGYDVVGGVEFLNVRTERKPGVVSEVPDPKNEGKPTPIEDPDVVYAGCIVRASVRPYCFDVEGKKGVTFGLNNVQYIRDGEHLDGRSSAQEEFDADAAKVADLSDLTDGAEAPACEEKDDESNLEDLL